MERGIPNSGGQQSPLCLCSEAQRRTQARWAWTRKPNVGFWVYTGEDPSCKQEPKILSSCPPPTKLIYFSARNGRRREGMWPKVEIFPIGFAERAWKCMPDSSDERVLLQQNDFLYTGSCSDCSSLLFWLEEMIFISVETLTSFLSYLVKKLFHWVLVEFTLPFGYNPTQS